MNCVPASVANNRRARKPRDAETRVAWTPGCGYPASAGRLDGDEVRRHLSKGLGFSREDRDANITRIGFVASEVVRHGGIVICAPIAPYAGARTEARQLVEAHGRFVEVHVSTPLEVCEARDRKGLYAAARAGKIKGFTGIDDPYEVPASPELRVDTSTTTVAEAADRVYEWLRSEQLI